MDAFSQFMRSMFGPSEHRGDRYWGWTPPPPAMDRDEREDDRLYNHHERDDDHTNNSWFEDRQNHFPGFPPHFDQFRQRMDQTFDELFKIFGNDSMPMFDPFRPPQSDVPAIRDREGGNSRAADSGSVRDRMLRRGAGGDIQDEENINVRSQMLLRDPANPLYSNKRQQDFNWDSLLKEGGSVHDILDNTKPNSISKSAADSAAKPSQSYSYYKYSSITRTRKPDGTVETRRVSRDADGNEKETVEITKSSL